jgi:hypothetical protein
MTAPLPPLPITDRTLAMPATDYDPEWISSMEGYSEDDLREYAKLAVREALERAESVIFNEAGKWETLPEIAYRIRAMLKEYEG